MQVVDFLATTKNILNFKIIHFLYLNSVCFYVIKHKQFYHTLKFLFS